MTLLAIIIVGCGGYYLGKLAAFSEVEDAICDGCVVDLGDDEDEEDAP